MTSARLSLHPATVDDWPEIWPVWHEVVAAGDTYTYPRDSTSAVAEQSWLRGGDRDETWLARLDGRVVGTYHLAPNQAGPGDHVANGSYMVDAAVRGRGLGAVMVVHSLHRAADLGFLGVQFNAVVATNVGAIALYERLGFDRVGLVPGAFRHPEHGRVDLVVMYRELVDLPPLPEQHPR
ncbi:N-acetyltransferase family protein [Jatrophihabitans sp. YIM 134969]